MPRKTRKEMKGRTQVNPQATFDFTVPRREVHARPVSMDVEAGADPKRTAILNFIEKMSGLAKDVTRYTDKQNIERRKQGKAAKGRGEDLPENPHWAFLEGYELISGASDAYTYERELAALLDTDINSDLDVFNQKKDAISSKYLEGRTDAYVEGFISRGMNVEANAEMQYQEAAHKRLQGNFLTKAVNLFKFDYREHKDTGGTLEENAEAGRELVTELQSAAVPYGLSKLQVSKSLVDSIGSENAMTGSPEDLMFFLMPDASGTAMIDNPELAPAINRYLNSAISTRSSMANESRLEKKRIEDEFAVTAGKAIVAALDNNDPALAVKTLEDTRQYMGLETYKSLSKSIAAMRQGSDTFFSSTTDQFAFDNLRISARSGGLSLEMLQDYKTALTKADYRSVFGDIVTHWQERIARGRAGGKETPEEVAMKRVRSAGNKIVVQTTTDITKILNPETSPMRAARYEIFFYDEYKKKAAEVGGASKMKPEDMAYVVDKAVYDSFIAFEPRGGEYMPKNPDSKVNSHMEEQDTSKDALENDLTRLQ